MKSNAMIGLLCITCFYGCASGSGKIENRFLHLERQNSMLEKQLMTSESRLQEQLDINDQLRTSSAELRATLDALRVNVQTLSGRLDEMAYSLKSDSRSSSETENEVIGQLNRVDEIARSNKERIAAVEQYLDFEVAASDATGETAVAANSERSVSSQGLSEAELYDTGKQAFDDGQYEVAREKFKEFLTKYPKSDKADNAQFWIGDIYYREKFYDVAIMEYQKVIENYPDGNKVPAAFYKQGLSFFNLEDQSNARFFLQEVINNYPTSVEAKLAREKLQTF